MFLLIFYGSSLGVMMGSGKSPQWQVFSRASFISPLYYWKPQYCYTFIKASESKQKE